MEITETNIDGVLIVAPQIYKDNRGYFMESFNLNEFRNKSGLNEIQGELFNIYPICLANAFNRLCCC